MKFKIILFLTLLFATRLFLNAQVINNFVVFCNEGERFTLILNGLKENQQPATNVRIEGLDLKVYEVKVIFENTKLKDVNTTLTFYRTGKECVFGLNKKGKKTHTMDYVSEKDIMPVVNQENPTTVNSNTITPTNINSPIKDSTHNITSSFQTLISNIIAQPTEGGKLNVAISSLQNTTFSIAQIKQILTIFSSEQTRLAFAKQLCSKIKDPAVSSAILDTFINEAVKLEFKKFTEAK